MATYSIKSMLAWTAYLALACVWFATKSHFVVAVIMLVTAAVLCFSAAMSAFSSGHRQRSNAAFAFAAIAFLVFDTTGTYSLSSYFSDVYLHAIEPSEMTYNVIVPQRGSMSSAYTVTVPPLGDRERVVFRCTATMAIAIVSTLIASYVTRRDENRVRQ